MAQQIEQLPSPSTQKKIIYNKIYRTYKNTCFIYKQFFFIVKKRN